MVHCESKDTLDLINLKIEKKNIYYIVLINQKNEGRKDGCKVENIQNEMKRSKKKNDNKNKKMINPNLPP